MNANTTLSIFHLERKAQFAERGQAVTPFYFRKKPNQNALGYYVSSLVFFYYLKIDHSRFLYI